MMRQRPEGVPGRAKGRAILLIGGGLLAVMVVGYLLAPSGASRPTVTPNPHEDTAAPLGGTRVLDAMPKGYRAQRAPVDLLSTPASVPLATHGQIPPEPRPPPEPPPPPTPPPVAPRPPAARLGPPPKTKEDLAREREARDQKLKQVKSRTIHRRDDQFSEDTVLKAPKTPYHLRAGALIPLIQEDQITSAAPGVAEFVVRNDVYDSRTGDYTLIPQGTKVLVRTGGGQSQGTERFSVTALTLTYPNDYEVELRSGHVGDASGQAGLSDQIDHKTMAVIATVLIQMFARSSTAAMSGGAGGGVGDAIASTAMQEGVQGGAQHAKTFLNTSPTFTIRDAYLASLRLEKSISLPAPYPFVGVSSPVRHRPGGLLSRPRGP